MSIDNGCYMHKSCTDCEFADCLVNKQKLEIERLTRELNDTVSMNEMYIKEVEKNAELQKQVDELKERLHWIWRLGVDYDGFEKSESLKGLIDEMIEFTQMESKDFVEYQQSKDGLREIENKYGVEVE